MIGRLQYVICDDCGDPAPVGDSAGEARTAARREGFVQLEGRDLCFRCDPNSKRCVVCHVTPDDWDSGCTTADRRHVRSVPSGGEQ